MPNVPNWSEDTSNLRLVQTCAACPEQYNVFDENDELVGYLRLRHGSFTAKVGGSDGEEVYSAYTQGDGIFESGERGYHLGLALTAIARALLRKSSVT